MSDPNRPQFPISLGSGLSGAGGAILTLMFFLPWFSACNLNVSGKDLAFGLSLDMGILGGSSAPPTYPWLALVLVCGLAATGLALAGLVSNGSVGTGRQLAMLAVGALATVLMLFVVFGYFGQAGSSTTVIQVEYGLPSSVAGAVLILVGALMDWQASRTRRAPEPVSTAGFSNQPPVATLAPPAAPPLSSARFAAQAQLMCRSGALAGQSFDLLGDRITIGRSSENQIHIQDGAASRLHAVIRFAQGRYFLQDQQSSHGTLVNGRPIQATAINDGDIITIGETEFEFQVE